MLDIKKAQETKLAMNYEKILSLDAYSRVPRRSFIVDRNKGRTTVINEKAWFSHKMYYATRQNSNEAVFMT